MGFVFVALQLASQGLDIHPTVDLDFVDDPERHALVDIGAQAIAGDQHPIPRNIDDDQRLGSSDDGAGNAVHRVHDVAYAADDANREPRADHEDEVEANTGHCERDAACAGVAELRSDSRQRRLDSGRESGREGGRSDRTAEAGELGEKPGPRAEPDQSDQENDGDDIEEHERTRVSAQGDMDRRHCRLRGAIRGPPREWPGQLRDDRAQGARTQRVDRERGMDRNLALELVRVTEAAAINAARTMGRGDVHASDQAAVSAMRTAFQLMEIDGTIVIGEGELDEAPMLYIGEKVGRAAEGDEKVDIALDPLEGTGLCAYGRPGALAVVAMAKAGCFLHAPDMYMDKIATGSAGRDVIDITKTPTENVYNVAAAKGVTVEELTVVILDRSRHEDTIREVRAAGARIKLIQDGDVHAAIATCADETGIDLMLGIGGAPEGVLAAAALQCIGGGMQGQLVFKNDRERERAKKMMAGRDIYRVLTIDDLAHGDIVFAATGVTSGDMLRGVRFTHHGCETHSIAMRNKSGTVRHIEAKHVFNDKPNYSTEGFIVADEQVDPPD